MEILVYEKIPRIIKNKKRLEGMLNVKISINGKEITVSGTAEDEYFAEKVISALEFGFPFTVALSLRTDENMFEVIHIKDHTHKKDLTEVRARIIGTKGKTLRALTELTKCHFELNGNFIGIVGEPELMRNAQEAAISIIRGAKQGNVYAFLEKRQVKPVLDLGLKEPKKPKRKQR